MHETNLPVCNSYCRFQRIYGSPTMNIDIAGALFTLSFSILILNSQRKEGASDVKDHRMIPVNCF